MNISSQEVRKLFLDFFKERGHKVIPSSSLIPQDDASVLLTTAGMQQFKPYFTGAKDARADFGTQRLCSVQKCFRTTDIDEVGDSSHNTFFEMLGNFSFAAPAIASGEGGVKQSKDNDDPNNFGADGYFKRAAIYWARQFIEEILKLKIDYVTVFKGEGSVPFDETSYQLWQELGFSGERLRLAGRADNFWGPTGDEGPCGPTTELYVGGVEIHETKISFRAARPVPVEIHETKFRAARPESVEIHETKFRAARPESVEIWNNVFNEYYQAKDGQLKKLTAPGVDTGMGLERLLAVLQGKETIFETDLFLPLRARLEEYQFSTRDLRIILDHLRSSVFLIADGVQPSNLERGYILRRLVRRLALKLYQQQVQWTHLPDWVAAATEPYTEVYPELQASQEITKVIATELEKFSSVLERGLKAFDKTVTNMSDPVLLGEQCFQLHSSQGLPIEISLELLRQRGLTNTNLVLNAYQQHFTSHQDISRT